MASTLVLRSLLAARDPLADAKDTLSSWDKCMAKNYCKWPVIVAIVVGSLIVLSVVLCVARCVCCGAEVACCCFKCCSCCCPSGRGGHKRMKSASEPPPPPAYHPSAYSAAPPAPVAAPMDSRPLNQQYRSHAAPTFNPAPAPVLDKPAFARFDEPSKPANEDALPAMPSWNDAKRYHVEEDVIPEKRGDMELDRLDQNGSAAGSSVAGAAAGAAAVGAARRSPRPGRSPVQRAQTQDSYGFPPGYQNDSLANVPPQRSPHGTPGPYNRPYGQQQEGYRGISPVNALSPVYGAGQSQQHDRRSPGPGYNQYRQVSPAHSPSPVSSYDNGYNHAVHPSRSPVNMQGNGMPYDTGYAPARSNTPGYTQHPAHPPVSMPEPDLRYGNEFSQPPVRTQSPGYTPSESTRYEPSESTRYEPFEPSRSEPHNSEPGQAAYPGQPTYQAYVPGQTQGQPFAGVQRKAVDGSWKEV